MIEIFKHANFDFLGKKLYFIGLSWVLIIAGWGYALYRTFDGKDYTHPFNMGVDFAGGTLVDVKLVQSAGWTGENRSSCVGGPVGGDGGNSSATPSITRLT